METPNYILSIEVYYQSNGFMNVTQAKYIKDIISKVNMVNANVVNTHIYSHYKLSKHGTDNVIIPLLYKSTVRALQYVTITLPNIAYCLNKVLQFIANPPDTHCSVVKRILKGSTSDYKHMKDGYYLGST